MMLEVADLAVSYGHIRAVRGIDLQVDAGEAVALLGPNGAGKTSTLNAISGLCPADGTVTFDGQVINGRSPEAISRAGLIHVPEGRHVFANLSVHENLEVARSARGGRPETFGIDEVYDLFPALVPLRRREGWALSGGEQQMVAVGRALVAAPRLLMLDEPSLGLAPIVADAVFEALATVRSQVAMLVVEQNTAQALSLCDRAYVLVEGEIAVERSSGDLEDRAELLDTYLGRSDLDR